MTYNTKSKYSHLRIIVDKIQHSIEVVEEYKYLGMWISKNNKKHLESLEKNGRRSAFLTSRKLKEFGNINGTVIKEAFEMLTLSQIKYCGELCFDNNLTALNSLQVQFYKRFCHLKITTPSYCIFGEFGVKPIEFHFYKAALTYWVRLITSENKNWINLVYDRILENINDHKFSKTWCSRIKTLLYDLQLSQLWENQMQAHAALHINVIKRRLEERFREKWIESAKHSHKGMNYLEICRFDCEMKSYLNFITKGENINKFLKLRAGNHTLSVGRPLPK